MSMTGNAWEASRWFRTAPFGEIPNPKSEIPNISVICHPLAAIHARLTAAHGLNLPS